MNIRFNPILSLIFLTTVILSCKKEEVNPSKFKELADFVPVLQNFTDSIQNLKKSQGISVSVRLNDIGTWNGAAGESHPQVKMTPEMVMGIASNTKLMTSVLILKLLSSKQLSLSDTLGKYLTKKYEHIDQKITIKQLLNHYSGLDECIKDNKIDELSKDPEKKWAPEEVLALLEEVLNKPGEKFNYSNTNYILLGMILEKITGRKYHELVQDSIINPLQLRSTFVESFQNITKTMAHPWYEGVDIANISRNTVGTLSWAAGGVVSTPSDMVTWYHALFQDNFLKPNIFSELVDFANTDDPTNRYGLGLTEIIKNDKKYWGHGGETVGYSSFFLYDPQSKYIIAIIMNTSDLDPQYYAVDLAEKLSSLTQ